MPKGTRIVRGEYGFSENQEPVLKLEELLVEPQKDYKELIHQNQIESNRNPMRPSVLNSQHYWSTSHILKMDTAILAKENKELIDSIRNGLRDEILVDLGGGWGDMWNAAIKVNAKAYINIDKNPPTHWDKAIDVTTNLSPSSIVANEGNRTELLEIKADMLDFLSRLPDNSVNIVMNGIDDTILNNQEYIRAVANEITRVTKKGGFVFGSHSAPLDWMHEVIKNLKEGERTKFRIIDTKTLDNDVLFLYKSE